MAGLDYTSTTDPTDDEDTGPLTSTAADAGAPGPSRGALQSIVDAANDTSGVHSALARVAQALKANRQQNQIQTLFAAAGALGAPTRTGSIGEVASNLGKTLNTTLGDQNTAERQGDATAAKLQFDEEKAESQSRRAMGVQALKLLNTQSPMQKQLGKISYGPPDAQGRVNAYRTVEDPNSPGQLTFQLLKVFKPGETIPTAGPPAAAAPMPNEGDIGPDGQIAAPAPVAPTANTPADDTIPNRPVSDLPAGGVTGKPVDLEKQFGFKARGIDLSSFDPNTPIYVNTTTMKPEALPPGDPLVKYGVSGLTGPAVLAALPAAKAAEVQAILDGRLLAPTTGTRAKDGAELLQLASAADPTFDAGVAKAKFATRNAFAPNGKIGQNFASIDTVMNHLGKYAQGVEDINNMGGLGTGLNPVKNLILEKTGHASPTNLENEATAVASELTRTFRGGPGTMKDVQDWRKNVNINGAPDQQAGTINTGLGLVVGRLEPLVSQWNSTMGENRSVLSFISPAARQTFMKLDPSYQLTDDDKAYLASQEMAKRKTGTLAAPPAAVARVAATPGPSSTAGGKALPPSTLSQYQTVPMANKAAARAYLQSQGYDISGLK